MALIICTECGKKFSDKAVMCPECGCPTEEVLKALNKNKKVKSVTDKKSKGLSNENKNDANKAIKEIVDEVEKDKQTALSKFKRKTSSIKHRASHSIYIDSPNVLSQYASLQTDIRVAYDDLYTTLQALLEYVDTKCRPLLVYKPDGEYVKKVYELIRSLNEESEMEGNITTTIDNYYQGAVKTINYMPGVESKSIERFWKSTAAKTPISEKYKKDQQRKREKSAEKEIAKKEEKQRQLERKLEWEKKQAEKDEADGIVFKASYEESCQECSQLVEQYRSELENEVKYLLSEFTEKIVNDVLQLEKNKERLSVDLVAIEPWHVIKKNEIKQQIAALDREIALLSDDRTVESEKKRLYEILGHEIQSFSEKTEAYLTKKYPNRKKDVQDSVKYRKERYFRTSIPTIPNAKEIFANQ